MGDRRSNLPWRRHAHPLLPLRLHLQLPILMCLHARKNNVWQGPAPKPRGIDPLAPRLDAGAAIHDGIGS
jgi:hypothetical protein